jgi:hypothetical protein
MTLEKLARILILASAILGVVPAWAQPIASLKDLSAGAWRMVSLEVGGAGGLLQRVKYSGQMVFTDAETISVQAVNPDTSQTRVRFTVGGAEIRVRITDNPTSGDFVSMLPLTLDFSDFNAMEKISYLPRKLITEGSTGRAPANGDLIYFVPWGNIGFFYDSERRDASFDDRVIPIGTVETGYERLKELESGPVRIERIP